MSNVLKNKKTMINTLIKNIIKKRITPLASTFLENVVLSIKRAILLLTILLAILTIIGLKFATTSTLSIYGRSLALIQIIFCIAALIFCYLFLKFASDRLTIIVKTFSSIFCGWI